VSTTVLNSTTSTSEAEIDVTGFRTQEVYYSANSDLSDQLMECDNILSGTVEGVVLVKLNIDSDYCSEVEVEHRRGRHSESEADTIDAAIAHLIVVRDALRKMAAVA
jgi:hypothetical protein